MEKQKKSLFCPEIGASYYAKINGCVVSTHHNPFPVFGRSCPAPWQVDRSSVRCFDTTKDAIEYFDSLS